MLAILFIFYILSAVLKSDRIVSTLIRDNKLIAVYQSTELNNTKVRVFGLKDGTTRDIFNSGETFNIVHTNKDSDLVGFDTLDSLKENKNKIWLRLEYRESTNNPTEFSTTNRLRYIDLDTMTLNNDSNFIKFPTAENFPVKGYTVNSITNELGSALYITGGYIYNKTLGSYSFSSSFYKYNFASKEWVDMAYSADGKLKPLAGHKSVVIGNRYLVILGGGGENIYNYNDHNPTISEFNSLYNFTIFDTLTNNWENVNIKTDIFDTNIANFQFEGFSIVEYKDKAIVLGGYIVEQGSNLFRSNEYLGILDFKSKSWNWSPMLNEDGSSYKPLGVGISIQVFNDQFIICTGKLNFII
jgi:predicted nuclease of predicted toxin-antitoxin system